MLGASVEAVRFQGEASIVRYDSSDWAQRGFCRRCGTHLFYCLRSEDRYILWMGTFDDVSGFTLSGEIYIDEKPTGYDFAGDHPRLTGQAFLDSLHRGD